MTELVIHHIASGQAFFSGIILIHLAMVLGPAVARTVIACLGLILVAVSATPLPIWLYAIAGTAAVAWIGIDRSANARLRRPKMTLRAVVLGAWWLALGLEVPYHAMPRISWPVNRPIWVVGDSLSAGMGGESVTWPSLLGNRFGVDVHSVARSGATVASAAREQAPQVSGAATLVLAEIGGNDILGGTSPEVFGRGLETLLTQLCKDRRTVVLFELPLPPFFNRYGAIQRRLARRHGAILVPKRVLLRVLTTQGATLDTVHLSPVGHERMAAAVLEIMHPISPRLPTVSRDTR